MDPEYAAQRLWWEHHLSRPVVMDELLAICAERGCPVKWGRLRGKGYYLRFPEPVIFLDHQATTFVLAHELYHHLSADAAEWSDEDELVAIYVYTAHGRSQQERDANRFAELLCSQQVED